MTNHRTAVYFVSDMHFGIPDSTSSLVREKLFVNWLDRIAPDATDIYFMGDMFDFWFEWKHVVPKGYIRLLGKLAMLCDAGIRLHFFIGNHDMWMFSYFQTELNAHIYREDQIAEIQGKTIYLSHGDGLGPGDYGYKFIKKLFRNPLAQWLYARLHPDFAVWLASFFSRKSRYSNQVKNTADHQRERRLTDIQIIHAHHVLQKQHIDVFIFGHQHSPVHEQIKEKTSVYNIGNWISDFTFLRMENSIISQNSFQTGKTELLKDG